MVTHGTDTMELTARFLTTRVPGKTIVLTGAMVPYIVMEYVDGMTLRQLMSSGRRLLPERALEITVQYAKDRKQFDTPVGAYQAVSTTPMLVSAIALIDGTKCNFAGAGIAFAPKEIVSSGKEMYSGYKNLVVQIVKFFQTGVSPVPLDETIEIMAFMEAADESKRQGGRAVKIADVIKKNGG